MGLENLKSVFADGAGVNKSQISGRYDEDKKVQPMEDIFANRTSAVDFFGGSNSYKPTLDPNIPGFTRNFNIGGYAFGEGGVGNSKYLGILSDTQIRTNNIDITSLSTDKLGYGDFQTPDFEGSDIRFTAGLGWGLANTKLQVSKEGNTASLFYTTTNGKVSVGASGAISNFGPISDMAQKIGMDIPPLDFSADIFSSKPLRYEKTVRKTVPTDDGKIPEAGTFGNRRGNVFQVITPNLPRSLILQDSSGYHKDNYSPTSARLIDTFVNYTYTDPEGFAVPSDVLSLLQDKPNLIKKNSEDKASETLAKISIGDNRHYYLANNTSFVKLGPDIYQGSILDGLMAGDIDYIKDKIMSEAFGVGLAALGAGATIVDKSASMLAELGKGMLQGAGQFGMAVGGAGLEIVGGLAQAGVDIGRDILGEFKLKGSSTNDPSILSSMGGFFEGIGGMLSGLSLPDINLQKWAFHNLPDSKSPILNLFGPAKETGAGVLSFGISKIPKPFKISPSSGILDLLDETRNASKPLEADSQLALRQQLLNDAATPDPSIGDPYTNPRTSFSQNKGDTAGKETKQQPYQNLIYGPKKTHTNSAKNRTGDTKYNEQDHYPSTYGGGNGRGVGDLKSLLPVLNADTLPNAYDETNNTNVAKGAKYGLPFYFKDLRNNKYIIFRGYLSGMNQMIQPEWTEHSYLGRSENTYVYSKAKRTLNFMFKVYAVSKEEIQTIYVKLNTLTTLAYPEYANDALLEKNRMRPPMCSLRIGELFGNDTKMVSGFIESLTFNWPDDTTWETDVGRRVPKECDVTVGFTVIHEKPPSTANADTFGIRASI